ncbi:MAG: TraR/DksA family transcriptional regulator [Acidimicrobiales bacterium]
MEGDRVREQLEHEHDRLDALKVGFLDEGLTSRSEQESSSELSSVEQHQADAGSAAFDHERDLSILEQVEAELVAVEQALGRLDDGTYGRCEACGDPIDDARLEARPEARFCLKDQAVAEGEASDARRPVS